MVNFLTSVESIHGLLIFFFKIVFRADDQGLITY